MSASDFWTATTDGARLMGNALALGGKLHHSKTPTVWLAFMARHSIQHILTDIQSKLNSTGLFTRVDIHNAQAYTPSQGELQQYSAVLVFSDVAFSDSTALGDVLANYADAGGGVVLATFAFGGIAEL